MLAKRSETGGREIGYELRCAAPLPVSYYERTGGQARFQGTEGERGQEVKWE